jgi:two-component system sensor histidine kinase BaeS
LAETRRLARLVEDLRLLSQAEAGQLPLAWETIDARALLEDIATSFSGQAQVAGVRLAVEVEDVLAPLLLLGDYGRLEQVIGNLAANALRHTPPGGQVTLRATASGTGADSQAKAQAKAQVGDEAGHEPGHEPGSVRLQVTDTGEGIAPEDLPFVFDRFWRGDRARTHGEGTGSGLGLAIARQLVQAHGGTIAAQSTQGAGTTFTLELPPVQ